MASSLAGEDSADLDLNAGEQEAAARGVEAEPPSAPDLDCGHRSSAQQEAVDASSAAGVTEESNMEVIDSPGEARAGADGGERSGVTSTIEEVEVGVGNGGSEKVDDKDHEKAPHEVEQAHSAGKGIEIQEEECSPLVHEATRSSVVEAETVSVSGVAGSCHSDSAQQDVDHVVNTPNDIHEAQAVVEEECKVVIVGELSVGGDQVAVKDVTSSSRCDDIAEGIDFQQEKEKYSTDGSPGSYHEEKAKCSIDGSALGRSKGECLADADVGLETALIVKCGEAIRKDDEPYVSQVQIHPNTAMEFQVTHAADVECQTGHVKPEGGAALVQMQTKMVVEDISSSKVNQCMDNRVKGHNPDSHLDVTDQAQGSNQTGIVCHTITKESETSVNLVGIENESLNMLSDVKARVKVGELGNGIEHTMDAQSLTEENSSSGNEAKNNDAVDEQFQGAAGICLVEHNNPNEGLVVECTDGMDAKQEGLMNQEETLALAGETERGEHSVLVVEAHQNDIKVDNSMPRNETNTHKDSVGSALTLHNNDTSTEAHLCKNSDFDDKNAIYEAGDSIGCPNTMSDALVTTSESRDALLAAEDPIKVQDVTVPPAWSNMESKPSDICSTDCNSMEKEYFVMEGLNLSVEISVPTASELSEIQDVISQDIESADQINSLEDKLDNPGGIDMDDEHGPDTGPEKETMKAWPEYRENDQHACYYMLPEEKHSFSISDLVWGKVKSHPWWPGQIFDPSYASELALKHKKKDSFLVAYFGDKTFAWCDESQLKPFEPNFSQMEKQSSSDVFVNAIDDALEEVSRRTELGMTCFCYSTEATSSLACQKVENAGIREGSNNCVVGKSRAVSCFHPERLVNYSKALAQMPFRGADRLELAVAKAHLKAFYMSRGYFEPSFLRNSSGYSESGASINQSTGENVGKGRMEHMISTPSDPKFRKYKSRGRGSHSDKQMTDSEMEKTLLHLTDNEVACELANGGQTEAGAEISGGPDEVYTGKIRKAPDSDSSDSDKRKKKKLDSLGDMEMKLPSPTFSSSFKVGECIRRVASQLAGSPSILRTNVEGSHKNASKDDSVFDVFVSDASPNSLMHSPKMKMADSEGYSPDELLLQLSAAAVDPMMGYKFVGTQLTFFTDFRNFCVVSSTEQRLPEKGRRGRKRKVETRSNVSSMLITDHMQDTYWSDLASCQSPVNGLRNKEAGTGRSQRRKRKASGQASLSPSSDPLLQNADYQQVGSPNMKSSLLVERSIIRVEEKMVDECSPTVLILNFNGLKPLPSETELTRIFSRYGPLKETAIEVQKKNNFVKVVFKRRADAEIAFSNIGKYGIFGPSLLSYRLRYLPLTPDCSSDIELQESNPITFEDVSFEILDTCQTTYMSLGTLSEDKNNAEPLEACDLETLYNCSIAYTSSDSKSEDKSDAIPVEDTNIEIAYSRRDGYASDTMLQDENVVHMEVNSFEIMDSCQAVYASPDTSLQEKGDAVPMEDSNPETPSFCQGNVSLGTESQDKYDSVPLEDSNLEIPDSCQTAYASQDTKSQDKIMDNCQAAYASPGTISQDKVDAVCMDDSNLETPDICQGNASLYTELQDKDDPVPLENKNLEIPDSCPVAYASQDTKSQGENNAVPMEVSNIVTLDICQGNASTDVESQDKNDGVPLEDGNIEIPESCQATSLSQVTSSQDKNDAVPSEVINLETPGPVQGSDSPGNRSLDKNGPVPLEDSMLEISGSVQAMSTSQDAESQNKSDAVPMEVCSLENSDTHQGNASPDTKSLDKNDKVPVEDSNPEITDSRQIVHASLDSQSQDKNDVVPMEDGNLETSDTCQDSEDKKDPVLFEDGNCDPENCQTVLVSSGTNLAGDDTMNFEDSSLQASIDYQTSGTHSEMRPHDINDAEFTKDSNLGTPDDSQIACTSPDTKPEDENDAIPIKCSSQQTSEDCQTPDTKSQEK